MKNWKGEGGRKVIKSTNNCYTRREKGYEQEVEFEEEEHNKKKMKFPRLWWDQKWNSKIQRITGSVSLSILSPKELLYSNLLKWTEIWLKKKQEDI